MTQQDEWRALKDYPDYEMQKGTGEVRFADDHESVYLTHDGKGLRLFWIHNEKGRVVAIKKVSEVYHELFGEDHG